MNHRIAIITIALLAMALPVPAINLSDNATGNGCLQLSPGCYNADPYVDSNCTCDRWSFEYMPSLQSPDSGVVGILYRRNGTFDFEGNATLSAREFLKELKRQSIDFCGEGM
jgi:hypothetical protein